MKTALFVLAFAALAYAESSKDNPGADLVVGGDLLLNGELFENLIEERINEKYPVLVARRQKRGLIGGLFDGLFGKPTTPKPRPTQRPQAPVPDPQVEDDADTATDEAVFADTTTTSTTSTTTSTTTTTEKPKKGINIGLGNLINIGIGK
ncbi:unnamed protein product [Chrysodeixis includens]|uniref:Uncharacterized protein n=1 Tax=Chrysodeixis includens TaxID=689277 RepID=A0A9P0BKK4_CHRIL|nr:unnamed protein product [Chrysodeixis includens]